MTKNVITEISKNGVVCSTELVKLTYAYWGKIEKGGLAFWFKGVENVVLTLSYEDICYYIFENNNISLFERKIFIVSGTNEDFKVQFQLPNFRLFLSSEQALEFHEVLLAFQSVIKQQQLILRLLPR